MAHSSFYAIYRKGTRQKLGEEYAPNGAAAIRLFLINCPEFKRSEIEAQRLR